MNTSTPPEPRTRRDFLAVTAGILFLGAGRELHGAAEPRTNKATVASERPGHSYAGKEPALIAIKFDLEMVDNFPTWNDVQWSFAKGVLNEETRRYTVEACKRVRTHGGLVHNFVLGRTLEDADVDWLKGLLAEGHAIGNHTYDHVGLLAKTAVESQHRFRRAPWLVAGKTVAEVLHENIRLTNLALRERLGVERPAFRSPGGLRPALDGREDLQRMFLDLGFEWVSTKAAPFPINKPGERPTREIFAQIADVNRASTPYFYPTGLLELPVGPVSDVNAFRTGRWTLAEFLEATELCLDRALADGGGWTLCLHPAVMYAKDPEFRVIESVCRKVKAAGDRARFVTLDGIAARALLRRPEAKSL